MNLVRRCMPWLFVLVLGGCHLVFGFAPAERADGPPDRPKDGRPGDGAAGEGATGDARADGALPATAALQDSVAA